MPRSGRSPEDSETARPRAVSPYGPMYRRLLRLFLETDLRIGTVGSLLEGVRLAFLKELALRARTVRGDGDSPWIAGIAADLRLDVLVTVREIVESLYPESSTAGWLLLRLPGRLPECAPPASKY